MTVLTHTEGEVLDVVRRYVARWLNPDLKVRGES